MKLEIKEYNLDDGIQADWVNKKLASNKDKLVEERPTRLRTRLLRHPTAWFNAPASLLMYAQMDLKGKPVLSFPNVLLFESNLSVDKENSQYLFGSTPEDYATFQIGPQGRLIATVKEIDLYLYFNDAVQLFEGNSSHRLKVNTLNIV